MGSPISGFYADIVMEDLELECLNKLHLEHNCTPLWYVRYLDDTCLCIKKEQVELVVGIFNDYHEILKFTFETEINKQLNFLDITIINQNSKLIFDWYQKPSSSNRILNFKSNHTLQHKKAIIYNLIDRALLISSDQFHLKNIKIVKQLLRANNYPPQFINFHINIRLKSIAFHKNNPNINKVNNNKINNMIYARKDKIGIPFVNTSYYNKIRSIFKKYNIISYPIVNKNLSSIIKLGKDKTNNLDQTQVVYKFSCKSYPMSYIGETKRALSKRIDEHRSGRYPESVVSLHKNSHHKFDWDNVRILGKEPNYSKRIISEMIHINQCTNTLNRKEDTQSLSHIYSSVIKMLKTSV